MTRATVLGLLLGLFVLRVAAQLVVALGLAPFLPPMPEWYSGLIPYGPLLASQVVIIGLLAAVCHGFARGRGWFVRRRAWLGGPLWMFAWIYASAMVVRYAMTMAMYPERRWTGGTIPIVFHLVLAAFLLVLADHHRRPPAGVGRDF